MYVDRHRTHNTLDILNMLSMIPTIIFENSDVVAVDKPYGWLSHSNGSDNEISVVDWAVENIPEVQGVGTPLVLDTGEIINRDGLVHRLDRGTSGVMLLAKTAHAFEELKEQFKKNEVKKEYCAFVHGNIRDKRGIITAPIGRDKRIGVLRSTRRAGGTIREARTDYVVETSSSEISFVYFYPQTGRTHQIRVHTRHIRHPIVGDHLYAPSMPLMLGFDRLALHARRISFTLPHTTALVDCVSSFPEDFTRAYALLKQKAEEVA